MKRMPQFLYSTMLGAFVIGVVLLTPSSGLVTLTIPDDTYSSATGPDTQHIGKRVPNDSRALTLDAIASVHSTLAPRSSYKSARIIGRLALAHCADVASHIRGPPEALARQSS